MTLPGDSQHASARSAAAVASAPDLVLATPQDYLAISKYRTAESTTEEFIAGKGLVVRWERQKRQNHWFDALYNACAAARYCGARLVSEAPREPEPPQVFIDDFEDDDAPQFDFSATRWSSPEMLGREEW
jgi:hypothetical protein